MDTFKHQVAAAVPVLAPSLALQSRKGPVAVPPMVYHTYSTGINVQDNIYIYMYVYYNFNNGDLLQFMVYD